MAKIIVTQRFGGQVLVDTNSRFEANPAGIVSVETPSKEWIGPVTESLEEIQKRINEAESEETSKILQNQKKILQMLEDINGSIRYVERKVSNY